MSRNVTRVVHRLEPPVRYFRLLLIGYFEGLAAERAIAWRATNFFALREFLGLVLPEAPPSRLETHEAVFTWRSCSGSPTRA